MGPAQPHQVIQQGFRQVALFPVFQHTRGAVALGEFLALRVQDQGEMGILRRVMVQGIENVDLPGRIVEVVVPAHYMGNAHIGIIHHHGQVVGRGTVGTGNDQIVQFPVADHYPALDEIVDDHVAVQRVFEPHHRRIALRRPPS